MEISGRSFLKGQYNIFPSTPHLTFNAIIALVVGVLALLWWRKNKS